jgi:hypothetical protein
LKLVKEVNTNVTEDVLIYKEDFLALELLLKILFQLITDQNPRGALLCLVIDWSLEAETLQTTIDIL